VATRSHLQTTGKALTLLVALEHLFIFYLEMFRWTSPMGRKAFDLTPEFARATRAMAQNQGLYNGFLAAGLAWGALHPNGDTGLQVRVFFLGCVIVAAVFASITVKRTILIIQGVPAVLALAFTLLAAGEMR
jgi:putative membrane protein